MTDTTVPLAFCYAPYCSHQFIIVEEGFLLSCPLTAHLYAAPSIVNLPSSLGTQLLPKQRLAKLSSQSLHSKDEFIQHVALQLHGMKKRMSQNSCLVY